MFSIGAPVMGLWSNGQWYPGTVSGVDGGLYFIQFDDGDTAWLREDQVRGIQGGQAPGSSELVVGAKVQGLWSNGSWYPGRIGEVRGDRYFVQFDDGDTAWLVAQKVRVVAPRGGRRAVSGPGGEAAPGARVSAEWTEDDWYDGMITRVNSNRTMALIQFDDGDVKWVRPDQVRVLSPAPEGLAPPPEPGTRVTGEWTEGAWYPGVVAEVSGPLAFVQFDDGDVKWLTARELRPEGGGAPAWQPAPGETEAAAAREPTPGEETVTVGPVRRGPTRCAHCGLTLSLGAAACPRCGAPRPD